jgi:ABC-2 type transport system permease protein
LKRRVKAPVAILVLLLIPLMMTGIIGVIFGPSSDNNNQLPKIDVLVVDNDKEFMSKLLLGAFDSKELKEMFQVTVVAEKEGKKLISKGKASALVIIPGKFSERLIKAENVQLEVIKNPAQQFLPEIVEEFMTTTAVFLSAVVQVFEPEIKAVDSLLDLDIEEVSVMQMTPFLEAGRQKIIAIKKYLDPLLVKLKKEVVGEKKSEKKEESGFNVYSFIIPGMGIMFLLFIIEIFLRDILTEREDGKLQRMMFSPLHTMEYIFARIISGWLLGILVLLIMVVFGMVLFGIDWGNYFYLFLLAAVTSFWIAGFFALLNGFFKNKNQAGALTAPIILVFSVFGGSVLQVHNLPEAVRWVSDFTPNQWFIKGVELVKNGNFPAAPLGVLLATAFILFLVATVILKKRLTV